MPLPTPLLGSSPPVTCLTLQTHPSCISKLFLKASFRYLFWVHLCTPNSPTTLCCHTMHPLSPPHSPGSTSLGARAELNPITSVPGIRWKFNTYLLGEWITEGNSHLPLIYEIPCSVCVSHSVLSSSL